MAVYRAPNDDYSSASLETVNDSVYINLFDEFVTDIQVDDRQKGKVVHKRLEKKWLGGIQIPFPTLYANGVVRPLSTLIIAVTHRRRCHSSSSLSLVVVAVGGCIPYFMPLSLRRFRSREPSESTVQPCFLATAVMSVRRKQMATRPTPMSLCS